MKGKQVIQRVLRIRFFRYVAACLFLPLLVFIVLHFSFPIQVKVAYATLVVDDEQQVLHAFLSSDQKWRLQTELKEISPVLRNTIVFKEDRYFYYHPGINPFAILRALVLNSWRGKRTSGASTITMQVARALEPKKRTYFGKLLEMFRALQLELKFTKDEILQLYLNLTPYGGNIEGVKAAAYLYFEKNPDHLSLAEITALSIIPNRPSSLVPGKNNDKILKERNRWLEKFRQAHLFNATTIDDALEEPLLVKRHEFPRHSPHLARKLVKEFSDLHQIETYINAEKQAQAEKLVSDYVASLQTKGISNAAVIAIDNRTHRVITYIGSANWYDSLSFGQVNGVAATREPGSTLKPLLYGLCMDAGSLTPKKMMEDLPINYHGYAPENYDKQFRGMVSMEQALEMSLNIPAVTSLQSLGLPSFIQTASLAGLKSIGKDRKKLGLSLILGGCGSSLEELTSSYTLFSNEGKWTPPVFCKTTSIKKTPVVKRIISPAAAFIISDILSKVNRPDFPLHWQATEHLPRIAWKTGTSYGRRDGWAIGYNTHYTIGVWTGNFSGIGSPELSGANIATPLLFRIFNLLDYDANEAWFNQPEDCDMRQVCALSGQPPSDFCNQLVSDYFIPLISSNKTCAHDKEVFLSGDGKMSYCLECRPAWGYKKKTIRNWSSGMQTFMEERKISFEHIPLHNPSCETNIQNQVPQILEPRAGNEYLFSSKKSEPLLLKCRTGNGVTRVFWFVNDRLLKSASSNEPVYLIPETGLLKISCTDENGRNTSIRIRVSYVNY